jgi:hypothetical protein
MIWFSSNKSTAFMRKKGEKNLLCFKKEKGEELKNLPRAVLGQGIPFLPVELRQGGLGL